MSILGEATAAEIEAAAEETIENDLDSIESGPQIAQNTFHFDFSFLKTRTGEGTIESYLDHVLNPEKSRGVAQILRGATGLAGELNLAILDIAFGVFQVLKEKPDKKKEVNNTEIYEKPIINA